MKALKNILSHSVPVKDYAGYSRYMRELGIDLWNFTQQSKRGWLLRSLPNQLRRRENSPMRCSDCSCSPQGQPWGFLLHPRQRETKKMLNVNGPIWSVSRTSSAGLLSLIFSGTSSPVIIALPSPTVLNLRRMITQAENLWKLIIIVLTHAGQGQWDIYRPLWRIETNRCANGQLVHVHSVSVGFIHNREASHTPIFNGVVMYHKWSQLRY